MFNYPLGLSSARTTPEVKTELLGLLGLRHLSEAPVRWPALWSISVYNSEGMGESTQEMYTEELGVQATTQVVYAVDYKIDDDEIERARVAMLVSAAQLVDRVDAVAVFPFEAGTVIMRRVDGVLYLREDWRVSVGPDAVARLPGEPVFRDDLGTL
ncbi:MAG: hypothetical protein LBK42_03365 [Propionibacteriaceae bacterium]|jgi:hypothetical protein|nr:hypothetical protein [Propionibacteriaceae bacterium]